LRGRPDEDQARVLAGLGEVRVLAEKSVAGMDCFRTRLPSRVNQTGDVEIGFPRVGWTDMDGLIRHADVQRGAVDVGVHGDGRNPELAKTPNYANGDFPTVRNQYLPKHRSGL
jgi:hypothetical protein